jgi:hypothetical protein
MYNLMNEIDQKIAQHIGTMTPVIPEDLGLDMRSFGKAYTDGWDYLIVSKSDDKSIQYYGGFEYVDKNYRREYGDYVIYEGSDSRVYDTLENYREILNEEIA